MLRPGTRMNVISDRSACFSEKALQAFQILDKVRLLRARQSKGLSAVIGFYNRFERGGAAVVEVGRVLPQAGERRGAILFRRASRCVAWHSVGFRFADDFAGRMQSDIGIGQRRAYVAPGALP